MDEKKAKKAVTGILLDIGAGEHLGGNHRHIYKDLAIKYNCNAQRAEQRIRKCIVYAFRNCDPKVLNGYLHGTVPAYQDKAPNYVFIARIARAAQEKLEWGEVNGD